MCVPTEGSPGRLKILVLSPVEPHPPVGGWPNVVYHDILNLLRRGHQVHVLAVSEGAEASAVVMQEHCPTRYFSRPKRPRLRQVVTNLGNRLPLSIARYADFRMLEAASEVIYREGIEIVLAEDVAMAPYGSLLRSRFHIPFFIRAHNVDTEVFGRFVAGKGNPFVRAVAGWQLRKIKAYEGSILESADGFSMISESDAEEARRLFSKLEPVVVGAGADLERLRPPEEVRDSTVIMHLGTLTQFTKLEAMEWFVNEVLPLIRQVRPDVTLELAGSAPPDAFRGVEGVNVLGIVEDEREQLWRGRVFVAPQFVGSGIRLKILNAMASGNAIVCTPVACEGIPLVDGRHALIREEASEFATAVLALLADERQAERLGRNARLLAEECYAWDGIAAQLEQQLLQAIARSKEAGKPPRATPVEQPQVAHS